jgi:hypothetical protein
MLSRRTVTLTPDYLDMLRALLGAEVDFLLIGAHARAVHETPRATGDLDLWVRRDEVNARRVFEALINFGAPLEELSETDFLEPELVLKNVAPTARRLS